MILVPVVVEKSIRSVAEEIDEFRDDYVSIYWDATLPFSTIWYSVSFWCDPFSY